MLKIEIAIKNNQLVLAVEDNGGGLGSSKTTKRNSTRNGLTIMEHIYELYSKLYKKKITHQIIELKDVNNKNMGLRTGQTHHKLSIFKR